MRLKTKKEFSAMPVMIPGSAIGSTSRNETDSRPKKRKRAIANGGHRPEHERVARRGQRRTDGEPDGVPHLRVVPGDAGTTSS